MESSSNDPTPRPAPVRSIADTTRAAAWFEVELAPHESSLRAYLHGMVPPSEIDDVVQESFARVLRAHQERSILSPRGLLFAVARNAARDLFRRASSAKLEAITEGERSRVVDDAPTVPETVSRRQETALLEAAIADLPTRCREVLILRKFENLSHREIARRMGIAEHTVEVQLTKALHRCEAFFARHRALPPPG